MNIGDLVRLKHHHDSPVGEIGIITSVSGQWCRVVWSDGCVGRYYDHNLKAITEGLSKTDIKCP